MNKMIKSVLGGMLAAVLLVPGVARATKIADVTRIYGQQNNVLMGIGMVYGLKGTGDGGDYLPAMKSLQAMMQQYQHGATLPELGKSGNVALVTVKAMLPSNGVVVGDRVDVTVMSMGAASSLRGGQLVFTPLTARAGGDVYGIAEGTISIEDPSSPTTAVVHQGMQVEKDFQPQMIAEGKYFTLVISDAVAGWRMAHEMAKLINGSPEARGDIVAVARDPRTVEVTIPKDERARPDDFIASVQGLMLGDIIPMEARVVINTKTSSIIATGDVEISPVVVSYKGLTITAVAPKPPPTVTSPEVTVKTAIPVETGGKGGPKLQDLVAAMEQLKVPAEDRVNIVRELYKTGRLHAKLVVDGVMP